MGGFSIWHLVILLVMLGVPLLIGAVVWWAIRANRRPPAAAQAAPPPLPSASVEHRLRELDALKAQGLIDPAEYADRRERILATL
jgi:hypothetical protein